MSNKPPVRFGYLRGPEGNAHCVMGRAMKALNDMYGKKKGNEYISKAMKAKSYEQMLKITLEYVEDFDGSIEEYLDEIEDLENG